LSAVRLPIPPRSQGFCKNELFYYNKNQLIDYCFVQGTVIKITFVNS